MCLGTLSSILKFMLGHSVKTNGMEDSSQTSVNLVLVAARGSANKICRISAPPGGQLVKCSLVLEEACFLHAKTTSHFLGGTQFLLYN